MQKWSPFLGIKSWTLQLLLYGTRLNHSVNGLPPQKKHTHFSHASSRALGFAVGVLWDLVPQY